MHTQLHNSRGGKVNGLTVLPLEERRYGCCCPRQFQRLEKSIVEKRGVERERPSECGLSCPRMGGDVYGRGGTMKKREMCGP